MVPKPRKPHVPPPVHSRVLRDHTIAALVARQYAPLIQEVTSRVTAATTPAALDAAYEAWVHCLHLPWRRYFNPPPPQSRPGHTRTVAAMQRQRDRLLARARTGDQAARAAARALDVEIKRKMRARRRYLSRSRDQPQGNQSNIENDRAVTLARNALTYTGQAEVRPENFVDTFHRSLRQEPPIRASAFDVDADFEGDVRTALAVVCLDKAAGPDAIPMCMLTAAREASCKFIVALWTAVGRLAHIPARLSEGVVVPVWKSKGDRRDPANYRPITLLPTTRQIISSALDRRLRRECRFDDHQWGFRHGTGTDHALAFLARKRRKGHCEVIALDLKAVYDHAPREVIVKCCKSRLSAPLAGMIQTMLTPGRISAKNSQHNGRVVTAGVRQGVPISPSLFNILMDTLLWTARSAVSRNDRNLSYFADDILIVASARRHAQRLLDLASSWAQDQSMQ